MSKDYRSYNKFVPEYLQGRPPKVIRHCLERKLKARRFSAEDVSVIDDSKGQFHVTASSGCKYVVDFGLPSCECRDQIRFQIPCKHFFAIFLHYKWQWNSLPLSYLQGAYLSQDSEALDINARKMTYLSETTWIMGMHVFFRIFPKK